MPHLKEKKFDVRDLREPGRFFIDDRLYDEFAGVLGLAGLCVYMAFCRYANRRQSCYPSITTISEKLGISRRTVIRKIQQLESLNIIQGERSLGFNNRYHLIDRKKWISASTNIPTVTSDTTDTSSSSVTGPGALVSLDQCHQGYSKDLKLRKHKKDIGEVFNSTAIRFYIFWKAYPKKRSKGQAEKAWAKIHPDEQLHNRIMSALERAKKSKGWIKDQGEFIPYPATWLNAKGWEDEFGAAEKQEKKRDPHCTACDQGGLLPDGKRCWCVK